ncbi:hypothetical protein FKN01_05515 [Streptomyces sp. 130]|uniref:hypothetical protein n=1 Tax=Streptomyces sp. 130 TaxID=2591006 RepID=UPI00118131C7|nr:hypothetical protein [Streptomyces sp. 130]TRV80734.1 hypothetical protein FKN01_05515 [Streptomyces sp. 130]
MTGTDDAVADDDALYVLTAVLLTPAQFPSVLGDDYPAACAALGLEPYAEGYGLVLGQDSDGARWTVVVDDVSLVAVAIASWDCGMEYDLSPDDGSVVRALPGWPLAVAVAAPGVPAPHDPEPGPEADGRDPAALSPPDTDVWGPAQRRLGADAIAAQWAAWRAQMDDEASPSAAQAGEEDDAAAAGEGAQAADGAGLVPEEVSPPPARDPRPGIRRALAEARGYLDDPPPPGRVRSSFAPGDARMIRADGPGWSMVARTDDIAFLLLDEVPGEILPVGRGPELPGLLTALDAMAVRPS